MSAYVIVDVDIKDPVKYAAYKELTPASIEAFGGKFLARGGPVDVLEGSWQPGRIVILVFPSREQASAWWASDNYAPAKAIRQEAAETQLIIVDGV